ncbi:hypothetical protein ACFVIM_11105 [Streptomyces sp. NPDC057638]|uniref:hypothetical protein n=1 Tax=Streptomyces sp. NPDC057638 TaxID=3346190 RepID=UPI0036BB6E37
MTTLAVTGHMDLTDESVPLVRAALRTLLTAYEDNLTGVSCIAAGADSLFAEEVTALGGRLVVVIPSRDYRARKVKPAHAALFDRLVGVATDVVTLPYETANRDAYVSANEELLKRADRLIAVWDATPVSASGKGGTADTVELARAAGVPVDVVWPQGAARRSAVAPASTG